MLGACPVVFSFSSFYFIFFLNILELGTTALWRAQIFAFCHYETNLVWVLFSLPSSGHSLGLVFAYVIFQNSPNLHHSLLYPQTPPHKCTLRAEAKVVVPVLLGALCKPSPLCSHSGHRSTWLTAGFVPTLLFENNYEIYRKVV